MDRRLFLVLPALLLAACKEPPEMFRNTDLTGAGFGRQLQLADHHGSQRTLHDFTGQVVVVFFGYTSCPDVCPTMLSKLAEAMQGLGPAAQSVQVLFVTLDPERDSPERLEAFVPWFHPSFLGLRGDAAQTGAVAGEFRIFSARREVGSDLGYVLDHSSGAYVFDPAGRLRLYIKDSAAVADIVADIRLLLAGR
jgi:protein SCO1/2